MITALLTLSLSLSVLSAQAAEPSTLCMPTDAQGVLPEPVRLRAGEVLALTTGATHAQLVAVGEDGFAGDDAFVDERDSTYILLLQHTDPYGDLLESQILFEGQRTAAPLVRWAGDLDDDGSPDLVVEYLGGEPLLLLSSRADSEDLVRRAGVVQRGGC